MIIAGTGHRPNKLGGYGVEAFNKLVKIAEDYIKSLDIKPTIISGMALGWDQALAQAAINMECNLIAYIPFEGQEAMWPKKSQTYYKYLLDKCNNKVYCSNPGYSARKMQKRNEDMVDNCDIVLALYDGTVGGTYNCIKYATKQKKEIVNLFGKLSN